MWMRNAVVRLRGLEFRPVAVSQAAAGWLSRSERGLLAAVHCMDPGPVSGKAENLRRLL